MKMWAVGFLAVGRLWQTQTSQRGLLGLPDLPRQEGSPPQGWHCLPALPVLLSQAEYISWLPEGIEEHSSDSLLTVRLEVLGADRAVLISEQQQQQ